METGMKKAIVVAISLALGIGLCTGVGAEPAKEESIRNLLQDSGAAASSMQMMRRALPVMKRMVPGAPDELWEEALNESNVDDLIERLIPVYQKHLSEEEVQAINAFNKTPAGQKLLEVRPLISEESGEIGQEWAQDIARRVIAKYRAQEIQ
jgi:hypothetical protein